MFERVVERFPLRLFEQEQNSMQGFLDVRIRLCENTDAIRVFWPQLLKKSKDSSSAYWRYGWVPQTDQ
jgi:hypothetical protein